MVQKLEAMKEKKIMTKHLKIEKAIAVINGKPIPVRDNLIYKHDKVNDAIDDFYQWLEETDTSKVWFDDFLEKHLPLMTGFTVPSDVIISRDDNELRFYCPLNTFERPDIVFDLCMKAFMPEEWGMLFGTPNQVLGLGIKCNIGAKEEGIVLDYKVYKAINLEDYNNKVWWNSTPLRYFPWPQGMRYFGMDFDSTGVAVLVPGGLKVPDDIEVPTPIIDICERLNIKDNPRNIRWIAFYLKDIIKLREGGGLPNKFGYYLAE